MKSEGEVCLILTNNYLITMKTLITTFAILLMGMSVFSSTNVRFGETQATASETDSIVYYYCFYGGEYSHNGEEPIMELSYKDGQIVKGYFWGTSDEADVTREGFYPGYFVLEMEQIYHKADSMAFVLDTRKTKFFSGPIGVDIHSAEEAKKSGAHAWLQRDKIFQDSLAYGGKIQDGSIVVKQKNPENYWTQNGGRKFVRITLDSLKKVDRSCRFEKDNRWSTWNEGAKE